jgi:hypothetical protein
MEELEEETSEYRTDEGVQKEGERSRSKRCGSRSPL